MIPLFDLHCDTFSELYKKQLTFNNCSLHINAQSSTIFDPYIQVCSIWSDNHLSNDAAYFEYRKNLKYLAKLGISFSKKDLNSNSTHILGIEDSRLLNGDISRLEEIKNDGVRVLTLVWKGSSCIGGGWDTNFPLTDFGKKVVSFCFDNQICVDLSHSSLSVQEYVINEALKSGIAPIYSHSCAYGICSHPRNITDEYFRQIVTLNGLVGVSLCPDHLCSDSNASIDTILTHIDHYLSLNGENTVALGCDFDGVSHLPKGINSIFDLSKLYYACNKQFGKNITYKIFFGNAYRYFSTLFNERS